MEWESYNFRKAVDVIERFRKGELKRGSNDYDLFHKLIEENMGRRYVQNADSSSMSFESPIVIGKEEKAKIVYRARIEGINDKVPGMVPIALMLDIPEKVEPYDYLYLARTHGINVKDPSLEEAALEN